MCRTQDQRPKVFSGAFKVRLFMPEVDLEDPNADALWAQQEALKNKIGAKLQEFVKTLETDLVTIRVEDDMS